MAKQQPTSSLNFSLAIESLADSNMSSFTTAAINSDAATVEEWPPIDPWISPQLRRKALARLNEIVHTLGIIINLAPTELEQRIYDKSAHKEQYLNIVAKLIVYLKRQARLLLLTDNKNNGREDIRDDNDNDQDALIESICKMKI